MESESNAGVLYCFPPAPATQAVAVVSGEVHLWGSTTGTGSPLLLLREYFTADVWVWRIM